MAETLADVLQPAANISLREILHSVAEVLPCVVDAAVLTALIVLVLAIDTVVLMMMLLTDSGHR